MRAEAHDALDARAVVPTAIEDHHFARCGQVRQVALHVHLALLSIGGCRQCHHPEHPRTHALGKGLDRAPLAGAVAPLEHDADLDALGLHPFLQLDHFDVQQAQLLKVILVLQLLVLRGTPLGRALLVLCHDPAPTLA
ncbi:hypothetical protein D3C72_1949070 [compost metagenome]